MSSLNSVADIAAGPFDCGAHFAMAVAIAIPLVAGMPISIAARTLHASSGDDVRVYKRNRLSGKLYYLNRSSLFEVDYTPVRGSRLVCRNGSDDQRELEIGLRKSRV